VNDAAPSLGRRSRLAAVVLAAGAASRFGDVKLLARLDGRPLLQHVLDAVSAAHLGECVVVLGATGDRIEAEVRWRSERRVRNPHPEAGLASSLQAGLRTLGPEVEGALVLLGDQPRVTPAVIERIVDAWRASRLPIIAARYSDDAAPNPVLIDREVWPLAMALEGDRGMGLVLRRNPELVTEVAVAGENPDVDTPADLARLEGSAAHHDGGAVR